MESQALVSYIEKIRYGRNISQEQMLEGVISVRQYRRYLYGEIEIPFGVFAQLASKMSIPPNKLLLEFEEEKNKERRTVTAFYNAVVSKNFFLVEEILSTIKFEQIIDDEQKMLFKSGFANYQYLKKEISRQEMVNIQKEIVDFPNLMKNKILTDSEMLILATILDRDKVEHIDIVNRFELIFSQEEFHISGDNAATKIQIVYWLAKYYGQKKNYKKVLDYCNIGIESNEKLKTIYLMEYFNYYKTLVYHRENNMKQFEDSLYKTIMYTEVIPDKNRAIGFQKTIKKDLNIDPLSFVRDYIKDKKM